MTGLSRIFPHDNWLSSILTGQNVLHHNDNCQYVTDINNHHHNSVHGERKTATKIFSGKWRLTCCSHDYNYDSHDMFWFRSSETNLVSCLGFRQRQGQKKRSFVNLIIPQVRATNFIQEEKNTGFARERRGSFVNSRFINKGRGTWNTIFAHLMIFVACILHPIIFI